MLLTLISSVKHNTQDITYKNYYLCKFSDRASDKDIEKLSRILHAEIINEHEFHFCIGARKNCTSPWASKTLDLLHNANCNVNNIEKFQLYAAPLNSQQIAALYDKMTQQVYNSRQELLTFFDSTNIQNDPIINLQDNGINALIDANKQYGFALNDNEIAHLAAVFADRNPTLAEVSMFAQANSEHCRHKIFNSTFVINSKTQTETLFSMIKHTYKTNPKRVAIAYIDNAAVLAGCTANYFHASGGKYAVRPTTIYPVLKVETHNHPTAISPYPGAATGSGGEIRDEVATGRGARPIAGLTGFMVSNLCIPGYRQQWETHPTTPAHIATPLQIMLEAPIGAARFNNEFGRANLCGFFRSMQIKYNEANYGYHKPIMLAGGLGHILPQNIAKKPIPEQSKLIVLGGPGMEIGVGGGAASSLQSTADNKDLDFASVQRDNAEMQRRATEVILRCAEKEDNPIISIHDVGAGGIANALPELVHSSGFGAQINLDKIHNAATNMSDMALWCNEAQERFVLAISEKNIDTFTAYCKQERCPFSIVGKVTGKRFIATRGNRTVIDVDLDDILGDIAKPNRTVSSKEKNIKNGNKTLNISLDKAINAVLQHPTVASKSFLITIGDRTIGGLNCRDQMVGPWQVPVSDVATTANDFTGYSGNALAVGERSPIACINAAASARMALAEAITNIAAADIADTSTIVCSANWMAACAHNNEDSELYNAVKTIGKDICPQLGIAIPVGKDSLSMQSKWQQDKQEQCVKSPVSLVITATAPLQDVRSTLTPLLHNNTDSSLVLIQLDKQQALGASILSECCNDISGNVPDLRDASKLRMLIKLLHKWRQEKLIHAYHDRSDGGLFTTLCEMSFASRVGLDISCSLENNILEELFNEEIGIVLQINNIDLHKIYDDCQKHRLICGKIAALRSDEKIIIKHDNKQIYHSTRSELQKLWSKTSYEICKLRDNPETAAQEYASISDNNNHLNYKYPDKDYSPKIKVYDKPKIAILREQGVNGQREMAAAFFAAGFAAYDINMQQLQEQPDLLVNMQGIAACGGFSYGDVLGAGAGWATSILENEKICAKFTEFFSDKNKFALGVCNGCQMLSHLKNIIPGADHWPRWLENKSRQFEARLLQVEITKSESILLQGLEGCVLPAVIAHGEGRAEFTAQQTQACMRYVDAQHKVADKYPANPNGSTNAITGVCNTDGRITIMMPHPERITRNINLSWNDASKHEHTPWQQMFNNAYNWCTNTEKADEHTIFKCATAET